MNLIAVWQCLHAQVKFDTTVLSGYADVHKPSSTYMMFMKSPIRVTQRQLLPRANVLVKTTLSIYDRNSPDYKVGLSISSVVYASFKSL
jgi:hypothetical protein